LHTITSNAANTEMALRNEHTTASNMVSTLKEELEKRLKDIMNLREERDTLQVRLLSFFFVVIFGVKYECLGNC